MNISWEFNIQKEKFRLWWGIIESVQTKIFSSLFWILTKIAYRITQVGGTEAIFADIFEGEVIWTGRKRCRFMLIHVLRLTRKLNSRHIPTNNIKLKHASVNKIKYKDVFHMSNLGKQGVASGTQSCTFSSKQIFKKNYFKKYYKLLVRVLVVYLYVFHNISIIWNLIEKTKSSKINYSWLKGTTRAVIFGEMQFRTTYPTRWWPLTTPLQTKSSDPRSSIFSLRVNNKENS